MMAAAPRHFNPTLLALGVWDGVSSAPVLEEQVPSTGMQLFHQQVIMPPVVPSIDALGQSWSGGTTCSHGSHGSSNGSSTVTPREIISTQDRTRCSKISHLCQALEAAHVKGDAIECNKLSAKLTEMGVTAYISQCKWVDTTGLKGTWRQPGAPKKRANKQQQQQQQRPAPSPPTNPPTPTHSGGAPGSVGMCSLIPSFLTQLYNPNVQNILFLGCGGGHDFVTAMLLYKDLMMAGKQIFILSNSFSDAGIHAAAPSIFDDGNGCTVKRVMRDTKMNVGKLHEGFCPEIHLAGFLEDKLPGKEHWVYAANVKRWRVGSLRNCLKVLCRKHAIDGIVAWDYGTDSLMKGDEYVVGDAIEDAVTVAAISEIKTVKLKLLLCTGFGIDQQSGVSNTDSLRAIAELTELGGFHGSISIQPNTSAAQFYASASDHLNSFPTYSSRSMTHRTNVIGALASSINGKFGHFCPSHEPPTDQRQAYCFLTPHIATIYALDIDTVAARSMIIPWVTNCKTVSEQHQALAYQRSCLRNSNALRNREAATL
eukprot:TRINITY_DN4811_c0_g3_i1.p1 TRINITY_DN4811_c0_g3~~TRINITY_DN4811_c0_g3_i1.p1  ORF type:complete len:539 (+),score=97.98 TRINITY_DN4811_c0_g3_i1:345-1961(+)